MSSVVIDTEQIKKLIPHRDPMLLVDQVTEIEGDQKAVGIKNVTGNEVFFEGHFPGSPIFPGVLLVEAMAQTAGVLVMHSRGEEANGRLVYFMAIDGVKFRKPVRPGDVIRIHVEKIQERGRVWKYKGQARVDDVVCAEAVVTAMIVDQDKK